MRSGRTLLGQLGVTFPGENMQLTLEQEIASFYQEREALGSEDILNLKEAEDPVEAGISKLLCRLCGPTFSFVQIIPTGRYLRLCGACSSMVIRRMPCRCIPI